MKLNTVLSTALMAAFATLSFGVQAADAEKAPAEQTEKAAPQKVKPHSHMTEKRVFRPPTRPLTSRRRLRTRSVTTTSETRSNLNAPRPLTGPR